ncbi:helix-turn-helix domain-containing protein [Desulfococcaceae bacterium HSG7]|nr:helix-turn-helix domain-containing protein [Desulfococcaceae bacterium HSG7]
MEENQTQLESPWLTFQEAADRMKLNKRTFQNYVSKGKIQAHVSAMGTKRFRIEDIDAFFKPMPRRRYR